jgi:hypothetical protein
LSTSIDTLLKPICNLSSLTVYWKTVRMRRRQSPLSDWKMLQRHLSISRKSLWQRSFLFTLIQSSRTEWRLMLQTHSDRNLLSVADVRAVTPCCLLVWKLFSAEESYETHDLELLVIVEAFKQWHHYLEKSTHSVKVLTDHNNLCGFMNIKMLNEQQTQWAVRLAAFDFVIKHRLSKTNLTDALSRLRLCWGHQWKHW